MIDYEDERTKAQERKLTIYHLLCTQMAAGKDLSLNYPAGKRALQKLFFLFYFSTLVHLAFVLHFEALKVQRAGLR